MWVLGRPPATEPGLMVSVMVASANAAVDAISAAGGEIVRPVDEPTCASPTPPPAQPTSPRACAGRPCPTTPASRVAPPVGISLPPPPRWPKRDHDCFSDHGVGYGGRPDRSGHQPAPLSYRLTSGQPRPHYQLWRI